MRVLGELIINRHTECRVFVKVLQGSHGCWSYGRNYSLGLRKMIHVMCQSASGGIIRSAVGCLGAIMGTVSDAVEWGRIVLNGNLVMLFPSLRALMSVPVWISEYSFAAVVAFVFLQWRPKTNPKTHSGPNKDSYPMNA